MLYFWPKPEGFFGCKNTKIIRRRTDPESLDLSTTYLLSLYSTSSSSSISFEIKIVFVAMRVSKRLEQLNLLPRPSLSAQEKRREEEEEGIHFKVKEKPGEKALSALSFAYTYVRVHRID